MDIKNIKQRAMITKRIAARDVRKIALERVSGGDEEVVFFEKILHEVFENKYNTMFKEIIQSAESGKFMCVFEYSQSSSGIPLRYSDLFALDECTTNRVMHAVAELLQQAVESHGFEVEVSKSSSGYEFKIKW
jgi:hypothetical protein